MIDEFCNDVPYDFKNILFTSSGKYTNAYTFSYTDGGVVKDASILGKDNECYDNIIKEYIGYSEKQALNFNVFYSASYGLDCYSNTFGTSCYHNTLGNQCYNNTFGIGCHNNDFGNFCRDNTFGNHCTHSAFGNICDSNTFGNDCFYIVFGTRSGSTNTPVNYYRNNILDTGCSYLCLKANGTAGELNRVQNIHVHSGVTGTSSEYKTITVDGRSPYTIDVYPIGSTEMFI